MEFYCGNVPIMALRCPNPKCGKPIARDATGAVPGRCPECGVAFKSSKAVDTPSARADDGETPFGDPFTSVAARTSIAAAVHQDRLPFRYGLFAVVGLVIAVVAWFGYRSIQRGPVVADSTTKSPGTTFQNAGRNYEIAPDEQIWKPDPVWAKQQGVDLAFQHQSINARLLVWSDENSAAVPSLGELADGTQKWLSVDVGKITRVERGDGRLADQPAVDVVIGGDVAGKTVFRKAVTTFAQGIAYCVAVWCDDGDSATGTADFDRARMTFRMLAERPNWRAALRNPSNLTEFRSTKFPYLLRAPRDAWRESADLPVSSRYADLKLVDRSKDANVVVSPRQTSNLSAFRDAYVARAQQEFDKDKVTIRLVERELKVGKRPAQRVKLAVNDPTGEFVLSTTFLEVDSWIYQIECRAPASKAASYEPAFQAIVESFELAALPVREPVAEIPPVQKPPTDSPGKVEVSVPKEKPATAAPAKNKSEPAKGKAEKKTDEKSKDDAKSKTNKRKSLDDLD